jgi:hypothetical protein
MKILSSVLIVIAVILIANTVIKGKQKTTIAEGSDLYETDILQQLEGRTGNIFTGGKTSTDATFGIGGIRTSDPYAR